MKIDEMAARFGFEIMTSPKDGAMEVEGGYASDLLSDVIARAESGSIWVTTQTHVNIVAVASLKELAAVVIVSGRKPDDETVGLANAKGVCLLGTQSSAYEVAGRLYEAGIRGSPK
jgi:hypothetical protein